MSRLAELVAELLLFAQAMTGYTVGAERPEIVFLPQAELQQTACHRPCRIFGWYPNGATVYLDEQLDPQNDLQARGILLHELVHFLQQENQAFTDDTPCLNWARREREAYRVQATWLKRNKVGAAAYSAGRPPWSRACRDAPEQQPRQPG